MRLLIKLKNKYFKKTLLRVIKLLYGLIKLSIY